VTPRSVRIHYRRLPDRVQVFEQLLVHDAGDHVVTLLPAAELRAPVLVHGRAVLEPGAPVVWFTYPGRDHDIGRFHLRDGTFTGLYANLLTPVEMRADRWETTDLLLDIWLGADGTAAVLDADELEHAVAEGWLEAGRATALGRRADELLAAGVSGQWPEAHVAYWTLEHVRTHLSAPAQPAPHPPLTSRP
jgi:predicted RNA-binding protein associated with RNAse of E/G family